eukprot:gb/GEZN01011121.1/.p1 GENE.gb/GEZN01011121.1/~~gb/GEZN01011121.1/.p1  ORF type:complete len:372 (+),score=48.35 gb/GEZN01011121.1/:167-1117(+)
MGVVGYGVANGLAVLPGSPALHFFLIIVCITLLGYLEGSQVAILALENLDYDAYFEDYPSGVKTMDLCLGMSEGIKKYLCGRQFFVVFAVFVMAQVSTFPDFPHEGMPDWLFTVLIRTGLAGALTVLMWGQLMPQILASDYPLQWCNLPFLRAVIYGCLGFEATGVTNSSWLLSSATKSIGGAKQLEYKERITSQYASTASLGADEEKGQGSLKGKSDIESIDWATVLAAAQHGTVLKTGEFVELKKPMDAQLYGKYPSPEDLRKYLSERGQAVPNFLLPRDHPSYVPAHLVALSSTVQKLEERLSSPSRGGAFEF